MHQTLFTPALSGYQFRWVTETIEVSASFSVYRVQKVPTYLAAPNADEGGLRSSTYRTENSEYEPTYTTYLHQTQP
jgi:hypothetical protein